MVYMGSKNDEDPDEILAQNHQILASVHTGRSVFCFSTSFKSKGTSFFSLWLFWHISDCVGNCL